MRILASFLLICVSVFGQITPKELTSKHGINFWFLKDTSTQIITLSALFKGAGSVSDPKGKEGLANFAVDLCFKGAGPWDKEAFDKYALDHGIQLFLGVGRDHANLKLQTLKSKLREGKKAVQAILYKPHFKNSDFDQMKKEAKIGLAQAQLSPGYIAKKTFYKKNFNAPYNRLMDMSEQTIDGLTIADLKSYKLYKNTLVVGLVGDLTDKEAKNLVDDLFQDLPKTNPSKKKEFKGLKEAGKTDFIENKTPQSTVIFAQKGLDPRDKDFIPLVMLLKILADPGDLTAKLFTEVREKRGLVYGVSASILNLEEAPLIYGGFSANPKNVSEAISVIKTEWKRFQENGLTEADLEKCKSAMIGGYPLGFQSSDHLVRALVSHQLADRPIDYFQKRTELIQAVTLQDIKRVAKRVLNADKLYFCIVGQKG